MGKKLSLCLSVAGPSAVKSRAKWPQNFANLRCLVAKLNIDGGFAKSVVGICK